MKQTYIAEKIYFVALLNCKIIIVCASETDKTCKIIFKIYKTYLSKLLKFKSLTKLLLKLQPFVQFSC